MVIGVESSLVPGRVRREGMVTALNGAKKSASAYSGITADISNAAPANAVLPVVSHDGVGGLRASGAPQTAYCLLRRRCAPWI